MKTNKELRQILDNKARADKLRSIMHDMPDYLWSQMAHLIEDAANSKNPVERNTLAGAAGLVIVNHIEWLAYLAACEATWKDHEGEALHEYEKPAETWRIRLAFCVPQPLNCCSNSVSICAPVRVSVTRLFPNGWTVNASP